MAFAFSAAAQASSYNEPQTYREAMNTPDAHKWEKATEAEIKSLIDNETFEECKLPPDQKAINSRLVLKIKR